MVLRARVPSRRDRRVGHGRLRGASVRGVPLRDGVRRCGCCSGPDDRRARRHRHRRSEPRVLAGAMVGPVYALPIVVISALVRVELATGGALVPGTVRFEGVVWQAFVFPALLGAVAGGAGGAIGVLRADARVSVWLIGGWRMLLAALGLAAVGILLARGRPAAGSGDVHARRVGERCPVGVAAGRSPRARPAEPVVPGGRPVDGRLHVALGTRRDRAARLPGDAAGARRPALIPSVARTDAGRPSADPPTRSMPPGYWMFLLVPAIATVGAGRWAGRTWRGRSGGRERARRGAGAGVVFAVLVGAGTWMAGVDVGLTLNGASTPPCSRWARARSRRRCSRSRGA